MRGRRVMFGVLLALVAATPARAADPADPGTTEKVTFGDYSYLLYTPSTYDSRRATPLLVMTHGCQTTAEQQMRANLINPVAERERFVVLYPDINSTEAAQPGPLNRCWQFPSPQSQHRDSGDAAALAGMTREVMKKRHIDPERVYAMGMSAGSFMTSILAAAYPDLYAAVGIMAGGAYADGTCLFGTPGIPVETSAQMAFDEMGSRARVVPRLVMGGDADQGISPACADKAFFQGLRTNNLVLSGGQEAPLSLTPASTRQVPKAGGYATTVTTYRDPAGCLIGERWLIHGMDHFWSGGTKDPKYKSFTDPKGPSGAEASWRFLSRYTKSTTGAPCSEAPCAVTVFVPRGATRVRVTVDGRRVTPRVRGRRVRVRLAGGPHTVVVRGRTAAGKAFVRRRTARGCGEAASSRRAVASAGARFTYMLDAGSLLLGAHAVPRQAPAVMASAGQAGTLRATGTKGIRFGARQAVPQLPCQPGDKPETDLQGRVPPGDISSGRAAAGYNCNLEVVGQYASSGAGTLEAFSHCAYFGRGSDAFGTQVMDISDPANPVGTEVLTTPAMMSPWESLRVNAKRKLLVADRWSLTSVGSQLNGYLDIYDVSGDCAHPRLISSTDMAPANGHEGWFSPDGLTYYMSSTGADGTATVHPVDITDAAHPKLLAAWTFPSQTHGGSTTEDGARSYICQQQGPPKDKLWIVDTSDIAARQAHPKLHRLAGIGLEDNQWCQGAYRVTYHGHPFLIQYGERSGAADCSRAGDNWANFGYPRIFDLADELRPKLVSTALLQVDLPQHCAEVTGEGALNGLGYSVHHCSPDRLYNPTILACDYFGGGMRVTDIRNPYHPVEIGYYNPGTTAVVGTGARPVVLAERHEILFVNDVQGFYIARFEGGTWPFKGSARCPEYDDYFYAQYNPGSTCPTANLDGIGKPAPGGAKPTPALRLRVSQLAHRRVRVSGRLVPPASVPRARACRGRATLTVRRRSRTLRRRRLAVRPSCRVATTVKLPRRAGHLRFTLRFAGNAALAASSRTLRR